MLSDKLNSEFINYNFRAFITVFPIILKTIFYEIL